ncbi:MAG: Gldg family protein [Gammaproteobacteria bacterium]
MQNRRLISGTGLILATCLFISINIIANAVLTNWRLDLTEDNLYTLSDGTVNILGSIDEPITLRFYFSQEQLLGYPQLLNYGLRVRDMLREYVANSRSRLHLEIIDPQPFSSEEDSAVAEGLQSIPIGNSGERAYFGLLGSNSTDDTDIIPFFAPDRESALEYELTKLVYKLANPEQRVVGVVGDFPLFRKSGERDSRDTAIVRTMREFFEVRDLGSNINYISRDIEVLMVVHPKRLDETSRYVIDQWVLKGGKLMVFVDPLSESDDVKPDPDSPMVIPQRDSNLEDLFEVWGLQVAADKIVGDINAAMRVQHRGARGMQEVQYLPWLQLGSDNLNEDSFITNQLRRINLATASHISLLKDSALEIEPLLQTSPQSTLLERDLIIFQRDPNVILENFSSSDSRQVLAAFVRGPIQTAFPKGKPRDSKIEGDDETVTSGELNAVIVADTDMLADRFWVREQDYFGMQMPQPIADNGDFVINALENLSGNNDLFSLRSRGVYSRPFEVVERIRRAAEAQYRQREQELEAQLKEAEERIQTLQQEQGASGLIMSPEQAEEIEKFRRQQLEVRKELRAVQHDLQKDIEELGSSLRFINVTLIPLLIAFIAVGVGIFRVYMRRRRSDQS